MVSRFRGPGKSSLSQAIPPSACQVTARRQFLHNQGAILEQRVHESSASRVRIEFTLYAMSFRLAHSSHARDGFESHSCRVTNPNIKVGASGAIYA